MPNKTTLSIIGITLLLALALLKGIDGALLGVGLSLLAGLGGYAAGRARKPK